MSPAHFHPPPAMLSSACTSQQESGELLRRMQLDEVILRWKKTTRALKIYEQEYGKALTDCLERRTDAELVHFKDPVEAAAFFCLVEVMKTKNLK